MGVIDTLSAGFGLLNRRPWVIGVPVLFDLFLWLGPRLSMDPLLERTLVALPSLGTTDEARQSMIQLLEGLKTSNLFSILVWQIPSALGSQVTSPLGGRAIWSVEDGLGLVALVLALGLLGLLGTCLYLVTLAHVALGDGLSLAGCLPELWLGFRRLLSYFLLLVGIMLLVAMPLALAVALVGLLSQGVAAFLTMLLMTVLLWLVLYLFFVNYAIFVGGRGPIKAVWESVNLVSRHFWSAAGLFVLFHTILIGTALAWGLVLSHPLGVVAAIVGNAYIASGLGVGAMLFYRERVAKEGR